MSLERRIARLEEAQARAWARLHYRMVAAEFEMDSDEFYQECEAFLSLPLDQQLAEVDRIHADSLALGIPWDELKGIKATLTEHYQS